MSVRPPPTPYGPEPPHVAGAAWWIASCNGRAAADPCRADFADQGVKITHRLIEVFSSIQRHEVRVVDGEAQVMVTKLTKTQRSIIRLLRLDPRTYGLA